MMCWTGAPQQKFKAGTIPEKVSAMHPKIQENCPNWKNKIPNKFCKTHST